MMKSAEVVLVSFFMLLGIHFSAGQLFCGEVTVSLTLQDLIKDSYNYHHSYWIQVYQSGSGYGCSVYKDEESHVHTKYPYVENLDIRAESACPINAPFPPSPPQLTWLEYGTSVVTFYSISEYVATHFNGTDTRLISYDYILRPSTDRPDNPCSLGVWNSNGYVYTKHCRRMEGSEFSSLSDPNLVINGGSVTLATSDFAVAWGLLDTAAPMVEGHFTVTYQDSANTPPVAAFTSLNVIELDTPQEFTSESGHMVGGVIRFDPSESSDPDGNVVNYEWDFDDGTSVSADAPNVYEKVFNEARVYNVKLTITDDQGATNTYTESIDLTLQPGDLIFLRSGPPYSWTFDLGRQFYTHVGMYIGNQTMIEALAFTNDRSGGLIGVQATPLSGWSYDHETYATLVRVNASAEIKQKAVKIAKGHLGEAYDFRINKAELDEANYYCSELIWAAYFRASEGAINLGLQPFPDKDVGKGVLKHGVYPDHIFNDATHSAEIGYHWEHRP